MNSKLGAIGVVALAGALLSIEQSHHIDIDASARPERLVRAATACPDNDNVPYSAPCLADLEGGAEGRRVMHAAIAAAAVRSIDEATPAACPAADNVPYSARCLAFLSGWFWRPEASTVRR